MASLSSHVKGILLTLAGVLALSPDSLLIRLISVDTWTLLFWRGILMAFALTAAMLMRDFGRVGQMFRTAGKAGVLAAAVLGVGTIFFVLAITHTTVANTLIILGASPLFAALFTRLFLGEAVRRRTWIAIAAAMGGIFIAVSDNLQSGSWSGDFFALCAASCVGGQVVIVRFARQVDMTPSVILGGLLVGVLVFPMARPLSVAGADLVFLGLLGLVVLPLAFGLLVIAPRYLPAPEVSLLKLLEMVVGPYWVWLGLGEQPGTRALLGGVIVIATLVIHSWSGLRRDRS